MKVTGELPPTNEIRKRIPRIVTNLFTLFIVLIVGYIVMPVIDYAFAMTLPGFGISIGIIIAVVILAVLVIIAMRILSDVSVLLGISSDMLTSYIPGLSDEHASEVRRILYNFCYVIIIVLIFYIVAPFIPLIPGIGVAMAATLPIVVLAIVVLLFWDIGRLIHNRLEEATKGFVENFVKPFEEKK